MSLLSPLVTGPAVIVLAACAMAGSAGPARMRGAAVPNAPATAPAPAPADARCLIVMTAVNGAVEVAGRIAPGPALTGVYRLEIEGRGNRIVQSGDVALAAGLEGEVGGARLSGRPQDYVVRLTLDTGAGPQPCAGG
ncbi:MAG: hypothetical protein JJT81_10360 [Rubellimicrobium sp.]|nr:hypothetical protein [Rubellimicrobium sp.]